MYPALYFAHDLPFPRSHQVFVAMPFARTEERWKKVIQPAIRRVELNGQPLEPYRVDNRQVSDSILTDILAGIANSALVFADITALDELNGTPIRNANVLYELGLAHAVRPPEEVVIFRSDQHPMLFDMAHIRVNRYSPEEAPENAIRLVSIALLDALTETLHRRRQVINQLVSKLDAVTIGVLFEAIRDRTISASVRQAQTQTMGHAARRHTILRLLDFGLIAAAITRLNVTHWQAPPETSPDVAKYEPTSLGVAVACECFERMGLTDPEMMQFGGVRSMAAVFARQPIVTLRASG